MDPLGSRKDQRVYDKEACKWRHLMENFFARIKEYRGSATRHDKTDSNDAGNWNLAATLLASRSTLLSTGPGAASAAWVAVELVHNSHFSCIHLKTLMTHWR